MWWSCTLGTVWDYHYCTFTLYGRPTLYANPRVVFLGFKVRYLGSYRSYHYDEHIVASVFSMHIRSRKALRKLSKCSRYRVNAPTGLCSRFLATKQNYSSSVKQTQSLVFHASIVNFFPIKFRIHCQPFCITMQAQLVVPRPQSSINREIDASANFDTAAVWAFLVWSKNTKHAPFRLENDLSNDTLFLKINWKWHHSARSTLPAIDNRLVGPYTFLFFSLLSLFFDLFPSPGRSR